MNIQNLFTHLNLTIKNTSPVNGGDINKAYKIVAKEGDFFIKTNNRNNYPGLFEKEANGLKALRTSGALPVPEVIQTGEFNYTQYLLLEWLETANTTPEMWEAFGNRLAQLHKTTQENFGFYEDNYLGTYLQNNTAYSAWSEFYANCRVLPLIKLIYDQNKINRNIIAAADNFSKELNNILPIEQPSLLHGDLWSGNFLSAKNNETYLIDPAVYYGHREMDIGMSRLFGGFSTQFYESYNNAYPLEKNWEKRLPYTQLYPLLFHAYAFGGHYIESVKIILKKFN